MTTTNTKTVITTGGGDYSTLSTWEADRNVDITAATGSDSIEIVNCSGATADTSSVNLNGWTTSAGNYIVINGNLSLGKWNTNCYRLEVTDSTKINVGNGAGYIRMDKLQIKNICTYNYGSRNALYIEMNDTTYDVRLSNSIIWATDTGTSTNRQGIEIWPDNTSNIYIWNCLIYREGGNAENCAIAGCRNVNVYNCCGVGNWIIAFYRGSGDFIAKNCYGQTDSGISFSNVTKTTCASSDTTGSVGLQNIALSTDNFVNISSGSKDLHLVSGSALIGVATDTSGESAPLNFTTDIDGQTRTVPWDIGADEYVAATPPAVIQQIESDSTRIFFI